MLSVSWLVRNYGSGERSMISYWKGEVDHPGERISHGRAPYPSNDPVLCHAQP